MKKLNLEQRGALLVLFPLLCQIVFVVVLTAQLLSIHANINKQSQSCDLITKTISLIAYSVSLGRMNGMGGGSHPFAATAEARAHITGVTNDERRFAVLDDKLQQIGSRKEVDQLQRQRIDVLVRTGEETLRCLKDVRDNQAKGWKYWKHVHWQYEMALVISCQQLLNCADSVVEYEEGKRQGSEAATNSQFQTLNSYLLSAIAATVAAAFVMAAFYIRDILIPLKHLSANCLRISKQEDLLPQLSDGSEFSDLDQILHYITVATKEEQEKEQSMVENTNDLICSLSTEGKFLRANQSSQAFFGLKPEAIVSKSFLDFVAEADRSIAESGFQEALAGEQSRSLEFRVKANDEPIYTRWSCLFSPETKELFAVVHNIEQEKVVENIKQEFVDMVSHDLRSPLSSMHVSLDLLGSGAYGEVTNEAQKELAGAQKNLYRLLEFVNDLLDFQKLKHGKMELECDNASVEGLIQSSVDLVRPALEAKNLQLKVSGEDMQLFADAKKMTQVLTNLLANAIRYTPEGGEITVAWKNSTEQIEISVSDTGPGIAEADSKRIFEAFEQTPESVSKGEGPNSGE